MTSIYYTIYSYPQGEFLLVGSSEGLSIVHFLEHPDETSNVLDPFEKMSIPVELNNNKFRKERKLFDRYFSGEKEDFRDLQLHFLSGTPYQKRVWLETRKIPYGHTVFYRTIAHNLNHKGYRSVGQALNRNPLAIVIPCHRVIGSDGSLTGFGAGLEIKEYLLNLEGDKA